MTVYLKRFIHGVFDAAQCGDANNLRVDTIRQECLTMCFPRITLLRSSLHPFDIGFLT